MNAIICIFSFFRCSWVVQCSYIVVVIVGFVMLVYFLIVSRLVEATAVVSISLRSWRREWRTPSKQKTPYQVLVTAPASSFFTANVCALCVIVSEIRSEALSSCCRRFSWFQFPISFLKTETLLKSRTGHGSVRDFNKFPFSRCAPIVMFCVLSE